MSVRVLHVYDETDVVKPAYTGANGYRFYEEPQLLTLQQMLFYREMEIELRQIRQPSGQPHFQIVDALRSHRDALAERLARTRLLLETVDLTVDHLQGKALMNDERICARFTVGAGGDRLGERVQLGGEPNDYTVRAADTGRAMSVFEFRGGGGWPRHWQHEQAEWLYLVEGELACEIGDRRLRHGESVFVPRAIAQVWAARGGVPVTVFEVYLPTGRMERFFREVGQFTESPTRGTFQSFARNGCALSPLSLARRRTHSTPARRS